MLFDGIRLVQGAEVNISAVNIGPEFPGAPTIGELFYADGTGTPLEGLYTYTSTGWTLSSLGYTPVNKAGDTMTGYLTLHANPSSNLHAATKLYVDTITGAVSVSTLAGTPGIDYLNNAFIAQAGVTQHQAALAIAESQITNGLILARVAENETITGTWTFSGLGQLHVPTPTQDTHATNKAYVDLVATGLTVRSAVRVATLAPLPACTYNNGASGVGATLTANANGTLTVDGELLGAGEAVLVKDQADLKQNGVYVVQAAGAADPGGSLWILSRRVSTDTSSEIPGTFVFVNDGTQIGTGWVLTVANPATFAVGTDNISVEQFSDTGMTVLGGVDTNVQFNDAGVLGGQATFTYDKVADELSVGTVWGTKTTGDVEFGATVGSGTPVSASLKVTTAQAQLGTWSNHVLALYANNIERATVSGAGNVVINAATSGTTLTVSGLLATTAATTTESGLRLPHGTAPAAPVDGDIWTTSTGLYARINGTTLGPIGSGLGAAAGSDSQVQFNDGGSLGADAELFFNKTTNALTIGGATGGRLLGDMSTGTLTNRLWAQTNTVNGNTDWGVLPNGTGSTAGILAFNNSNPTDAAYLTYAINNTAAFIQSGKTGTGTALPLHVQTDSGTWAVLQQNGNINFGATTTDKAIAFNVEGKVRVQSGILVSASNSAQPVTLDATYHGVAVGMAGNGLIGSTTPARTWLVSNLYYATSAWRYGDNGMAGSLSLFDNDFYFQAAPTGSAGNAATLTTRLRWNTANTRFEVTGGIITNPSASGAEVINIVAGGGASGSPGASATLQGGASTGTGAGGAGYLVGGSSTGGSGGAVFLTSGAAAGASQNSGNITATIGAPGAGGTAGQFQWISNTTRVATLHGATGNFNIGSNTSDPAAKLAVQGLLLTDAPDVSEAGIRLPHGTAPSAPVDGDVWTTTGGLYAHINGVTQGPFSSGGAVVPGGSDTYIQFNDGGGFGGDADFTFDKTTNEFTLAAAGARIRGDLNNATFTNRMMFQSSVAGSSIVGAMPNAATSAGFAAYTSATFSAGSTVGQLLATSTQVLWDAITIDGTGTSQPHRWRTTDAGSTAVRMSFHPTGNLNIGTTTTDPAVKLRVEGATSITGAKLSTAAATASYASLNLPHGSAPSAPANGDVWTSTSGLYARINGTTVGPFSAGAGAGFYWQASAPGSPTPGDRWIESGTGIEWTWVDDGDSAQWVALDNSFNNTVLDDLSDVVITAPTNGQVLTYDSGAGQWENAPATTPGGSNTQLQFNNSGAFGGDADLTWNNTTNALTLGGVGARILGDFSSATDANRLLFQTSTATADTHLGVVPSTGGAASSFIAYQAPAAANSVITQIGVASGISYIGANVVGTATYPALELRTGSSQAARLTINNAGNHVIAAPDSGTALKTSGTSSSGEALLAVGQVSQHHGNFSVEGDARSRMLVLRQVTTNATPAELFLDGSALRMVLANDSTWHFDIVVVARRSDADDESAGYRFSGVIDRNTNAASTAMVGTVTTSIDAEDTAAWNAAVSADTTNGALIITVTGEVSKTIRWVAFVRTVEIVG